MLVDMEKPDILAKKRYVRTHSVTRNALTKALADARMRGLTFQGDEVTQEAFVNASWVLLGELDPDWVAERLRPILTRIESLAPDEPATGEADTGESAVTRYSREYPGPSENDSERLGRNDTTARKPGKRPGRKRGV